MRLVGTTVMLALLLGAAPALTQESPGILPTATQSEAKAARAQAGKHAVRRKAAPHIAAGPVNRRQARRNRLSA